MRIERVYCLENVTTVRTVLRHLIHRFDLSSLHLTLIFDWFSWIVRIQVHTPLFPGTLGDLDALLQEYGFPPELDVTLRTTFAHLDSGIDPIQVMQEDHMPIISCGQVDFEELEDFCVQLSCGIGYSPPSLC
jgi:hypothetical protein